MATKKKYYVVWNGVKPGIYPSWSACQAQIKGYPNAKYKSYTNYDEAVDAFAGNVTFTQKKVKRKYSKIDIGSATSNPKIITPSWSVDAACSGNPGDMEYRGVKTESAEELFRVGPYPEGTNNVGEFLGIVHALAILKKINSNYVLYTDSKTAMAWVRNRNAKTNLKTSGKNKELLQLVERAELWLKKNTYSTRILKWDTKNWGEIPADFGRK